MSQDPIEGVDYIVDYYAILDVPRDASQEEIRKAFNLKIPGYFHDRLNDLAEDLRAEGLRQEKLLLKSVK